MWGRNLFSFFFFDSSVWRVPVFSSNRGFWNSAVPFWLTHDHKAQACNAILMRPFSGIIQCVTHIPDSTCAFDLNLVLTLTVRLNLKPTGAFGKSYKLTKFHQTRPLKLRLVLTKIETHSDSFYSCYLRCSYHYWVISSAGLVFLKC